MKSPVSQFNNKSKLQIPQISGNINAVKLKSNLNEIEQNMYIICKMITN